APLQWPAGSGERFRGVAVLSTDDVILYRRHAAGEEGAPAYERAGLASEALAAALDKEERAQLLDETNLAREGYPAFSIESFLEGHMTPVLFGSALRHFGVRELLDVLADIAPAPHAVASVDGQSFAPDGTEVAGFVFKIQANMDPQ